MTYKEVTIILSLKCDFLKIKLGSSENVLPQSRCTTVKSTRSTIEAQGGENPESLLLKVKEWCYTSFHHLF
jgi:hypothetical protein